MTRLRIERARRGWTQLDVAIHTRIQPSEISRIETGRLRPYPAQLERLGKAFGIDPETLLDEVPVTT